MRAWFRREVRVVVRRDRMGEREFVEAMNAGVEHPMFDACLEVCERLKEEILEELRDPRLEDGRRLRSASRLEGVLEVEAQLVSWRALVLENKSKAQDSGR